MTKSLYEIKLDQLKILGEFWNCQDMSCTYHHMNSSYENIYVCTWHIIFFFLVVRFCVSAKISVIPSKSDIFLHLNFILTFYNTLNTKIMHAWSPFHRCSNKRVYDSVNDSNNNNETTSFCWARWRQYQKNTKNRQRKRDKKKKNAVDKNESRTLTMKRKTGNHFKCKSKQDHIKSALTEELFQVNKCIRALASSSNRLTKFILYYCIWTVRFNFWTMTIFYKIACYFYTYMNASDSFSIFTVTHHQIAVCVVWKCIHMSVCSITDVSKNEHTQNINPKRIKINHWCSDRDEF